MTEDIRKLARGASLAVALLAAACAATNDPHADHAVSPAARPPIVQSPVSSGATQQLDPAATLAPDQFDTPAPLSVAEANKAAKGVDHSGHEARSITPGEDHSTPPTPSPVKRDKTTTPDAHDHGASAAPAPKAPSAKRVAPSSRRVAPPASNAKPSPPAATVYTCPMHPEVTSSKPGNCPKCGMALVKKN